MIFASSSLSISIGDDSVYNGVSALGDVTKTRNHLHRDDDVYLRVVISRDEGLLFTVSSPESLVRDDYVYHEVSSLHPPWVRDDG